MSRLQWLRKRVWMTAAMLSMAMVVGCRGGNGVAGGGPTQIQPASRGDFTRGDDSRSDGYAGGRNDGYVTGNERRRDQRSGGARTAAPGQFDHYLVTLSWSPEFCYTHPDKPECAERLRFTTHGMWPENNDGSYPEHCSDAAGPANPAAYSDLYPDAGLLAHEWETHGTCSGMGPDAYFGAMRRAVQALHVPGPLANDTAQMTMTPDAIVSGFVSANRGTSAADFSVGCGHNFLTEVQECVDKNLRPVACQGVRSCAANTVMIAPPGAQRSGGDAYGEGDSYGDGRRRHRHDRE